MSDDVYSQPIGPEWRPMCKSTFMRTISVSGVMQSEKTYQCAKDYGHVGVCRAGFPSSPSWKPQEGV